MTCQNQKSQLVWRSPQVTPLDDGVALSILQDAELHFVSMGWIRAFTCDLASFKYNDPNWYDPMFFSGVEDKTTYWLTWCECCEELYSRDFQTGCKFNYWLLTNISHQERQLLRAIRCKSLSWRDNNTGFNSCSHDRKSSQTRPEAIFGHELFISLACQ